MQASLSNWQVKFQFDWTEKEQQEVNVSLHLIYLHEWGPVVWSLSNDILENRNVSALPQFMCGHKIIKSWQLINKAWSGGN